MKQFVLIYFICFIFSFSTFSQIKKADIYRRVLIDENSQVHIFTKDALEIVIKKDSAQVECDSVAISEDGHSVGWLALYPNYTTSYPIPLEVKIYSDGVLHKFRGIGLVIGLWHFMAGGREVAYEQETVHGGFSIHYELREIATERLIAEYDPEYGPDNQLLEIQKNIPKWVEELNAKQ